MKIKGKDSNFVIDFDISGRCVVKAESMQEAVRYFSDIISKRLCDSTNLTLMETGKIFGVKVDSINIKKIKE